MVQALLDSGADRNGINYVRMGLMGLVSAYVRMGLMGPVPAYVRMGLMMGSVPAYVCMGLMGSVQFLRMHAGCNMLTYIALHRYIVVAWMKGVVVQTIGLRGRSCMGLMYAQRNIARILNLVMFLSEVASFFVSQFQSTPLIVACYNDNFGVVEVLLAAGVNIEAKDYVGGLS